MKFCSIDSGLLTKIALQGAIHDQPGIVLLISVSARSFLFCGSLKCFKHPLMRNDSWSHIGSPCDLNAFVLSEQTAN